LMLLPRGSLVALSPLWKSFIAPAALRNSDLQKIFSVSPIHRCSPGYVGDTCQFPDPCTPLLCQNGGSCSSRVLPPSATPEYVCVCPPGFTGEKCQGVVDDPCFPSPCQHGGTCQRISGKEHQCQCLPGWTGKCWPGFEGHTCQHDINECFASPSPCLNGGSCLNSIGSFRCLCPSNFSGPLCQYRWGLCSSEICLHGGTCHLVDGGYHGCLCLPGNYSSLLLVFCYRICWLKGIAALPQFPSLASFSPKRLWHRALKRGPKTASSVAKKANLRVSIPSTLR
uniref:EGF-like domain-containing protein n=1 Tax=Naja naja TaxID=35670 RepID=A0A8C6X0Q6_NAJNA